MNQSHQFGLVDVQTQSTGIGHYAMSVTLQGRNSQSILDASNERIAALKEQMVTAPARGLPEVQAFHKIRMRDSGITAEIDQIHIKAIATLDGEQLATALAKIEQRRRDIRARLAACDQGQAAFRREVEDCRARAEKAIATHVVAAIRLLVERARQELDRSQKEVAVLAEATAAPLFALIDAPLIGSQTVDQLRLLTRMPQGMSLASSTLASDAFKVLYESPVPKQETAETTTAPAAWESNVEHHPDDCTVVVELVGQAINTAEPVQDQSTTEPSTAPVRSRRRTK
jgi:hypothetical protein